MPNYETNKQMKLSFQGEAVGTGDGVDTTFSLLVAPIIADSQKIYLDGTLQTETTNYTITDSTGAITFTVAPANGVKITADYAANVAAGETFNSDTIKNFRALRAAGKIRNVGQAARRAFTSGGRFRDADEPNA